MFAGNQHAQHLLPGMVIGAPADASTSGYTYELTVSPGFDTTKPNTAKECQDQGIVVRDFGGDSTCTLVGVFDGHGKNGRKVSAATSPPGVHCGSILMTPLGVRLGYHTSGEHCSLKYRSEISSLLANLPLPPQPLTLPPPPASPAQCAMFAAHAMAEFLVHHEELFANPLRALKDASIHVNAEMHTDAECKTNYSGGACQILPATSSNAF